MEAVDELTKIPDKVVNNIIALKVMGWVEHDWEFVKGKFDQYYYCKLCNLSYYGDVKPNGFCNHTAFGPPNFINDMNWAWELIKKQISSDKKELFFNKLKSLSGVEWPEVIYRLKDCFPRMVSYITLELENIKIEHYIK